MKIKLWLFPVIFMYCLLISATSIEVSPKYTAGESKHYSAKTPRAKTVSSTKVNFFKRLMIRLILKRYKKVHRADISKANNLANTSLIFGVAAIGCIVLGLFVPYLIFATIPAAIVAMITGGAALRGGTDYIGKAKTGKALGLGTLIAFAVLLIVLAIALSNSEWF